MIYQILFGYFFVQLFLLVKLDFTANDDKDGYLYNLDNIYTFRQFYFNTSLIGELPEESKDKAARKAYIKVSFKTNSVSKLLTDKKELPRVGIYLFKLEKLAMIYLNEFNYQKKFGLRFFQEYRSVANKYAWTGYVESTPKQAFIMQGPPIDDHTLAVVVPEFSVEGEFLEYDVNIFSADSKVYNVQSQELLKNYNDINFGVGFEKNAQIAINFLNKRGDGTKASRCSIILQYKIKQIARLANKKNKACLFLVDEQVPLNYIDQSKPLPKEFFRRVKNSHMWCSDFVQVYNETNMVTLKLRDVPTGVYLFTAFIEGEPAFTIEDFVSYGFQFFANVGMRHKVLENVPVNWTVPVYADWQAEHEEIPLSNVYDEL